MAIDDRDFEESSEIGSNLACELESVLVKNVLEVWYPRIIDRASGGFYANFDCYWNRSSIQEKNIVTQARSLWTASRAARRYPNDERYFDAAHHGFSYLRDVMWDAVGGGFLSIVGSDHVEGTDSKKNTYGASFGIFSLCAYYQLTGDPSALELCKKCFLWIEQHAHDPVAGGYFNLVDGLGRQVKQISGKVSDCDPARGGKVKDYNSSLHVMEALTELYRVWPDVHVRLRLEESIRIMRDIIARDPGFLGLYFDANWNLRSFRGCSREEIDRNVLDEHVSFGHDIESAILLLRAEASLASGLYPDTLARAKQLVDHTLKFGVDLVSGGIVYASYYYPGEKDPTVIWPTKAWWPQCEGLSTFLLFSKLYPNDPRYWSAFVHLWNYIKENLIDHENGDWFCEGIDLSPHARYEAKAHAWKCNYHTSRCLMWCIDLLKGVNILTAI